MRKLRTEKYKEEENLCKGVTNQQQDCKFLMRVKLKLTHFKVFPILKLLFLRREGLLFGKVFLLNNGLLDLPADLQANLELMKKKDLKIYRQLGRGGS